MFTRALLVTNWESDRYSYSFKFELDTAADASHRVTVYTSQVYNLPVTRKRIDRF